MLKVKLPCDLAFLIICTKELEMGSKTDFGAISNSQKM